MRRKIIMNQHCAKGKSNLIQREQCALVEAQRRGYVRYESDRYERERPRLSQAYDDWCREEDVPYVEVEIVGRYATVHAGVYGKYMWQVPPPIFNQINELIELA